MSGKGQCWSMQQQKRKRLGEKLSTEICIEDRKGKVGYGWSENIVVKEEMEYMEQLLNVG